MGEVFLGQLSKEQALLFRELEGSLTAIFSRAPRPQPFVIKAENISQTNACPLAVLAPGGCPCCWRNTIQASRNEALC